MRERYEQVQTLVERLAPLWQERMGLGHYVIEHVFLEGATDDNTIVADTTAFWEYLTAKVKWYLPIAVRLDDHDLETTLVHELAHVLLSSVEPLVPAARVKELELATELTARAVYMGWARG